MAEIVMVRDREEAGTLIARHLADRIRATPDLVLGLATGSTPLPVYAALPQALSGVDVSRVRGFALDEYVGLDPAHAESYRSVLAREVVEPLGLDPSHVTVPDGNIETIAHAGEAYEAAIADAGGIAVQILGIGTDGHIGFNEPGSSFASRTRVKTLTAQTRADNARFFASIDEVPHHCITQGLGTILEAGHLVLLAFGAEKAAALAAAVEGPVSASVPGSAIQLHPHVTVVIDEDAARELTRADYYRYAWDHKPDWQGL